jgi:hypothetical protein
MIYHLNVCIDDFIISYYGGCTHARDEASRLISKSSQGERERVRIFLAILTLR